MDAYHAMHTKNGKWCTHCTALCNIFQLSQTIRAITALPSIQFQYIVLHNTRLYIIFYFFFWKGIKIDYILLLSTSSMPFICCLGSKTSVHRIAFMDLKDNGQTSESLSDWFRLDALLYFYIKKNGGKYSWKLMMELKLESSGELSSSFFTFIDGLWSFFYSWPGSRIMDKLYDKLWIVPQEFADVWRQSRDVL